MHQHVLGLQVPVDELLPVQVLEAQDDLRSVKLSQLGVKSPVLLHYFEELAALHELHLNVKGARVLLNAQHVNLEK